MEVNDSSVIEDDEDVFVTGIMGQNGGGVKPKGCRTEIDVGDKSLLLLLF